VNGEGCSSFTEAYKVKKTEKGKVSFLFLPCELQEKA
jgi:hypothetical protein